MNKSLFLTICAFVLSFFNGEYSAHAQGKKLSVYDAEVGFRTHLAPERWSNTQWIPQEYKLSRIHANRQKLEIVDIKGNAQKLMSLEELNNMLKDHQLESFKAFPNIKWITKSSFTVKQGETTFIMDTKEGIVSSFKTPEGVANLDLSSEGKFLAYTLGNKLYVVSDGGELISLTENLSDVHVAGQSVSRNEFGISKGTFFSPKGDKLAYYVKDESAVSEYPILDITPKVAKAKHIRYPMAGDPSEKVYLRIVDLQTKTEIQIASRLAPDAYLTNISWLPNGKEVMIAELNREQNYMQLNVYDTSTGECVSTILEERRDTYVEPQHTALFLPSSQSKFIWQTREDGYNHMYLLDINEPNKKQQLTSGNWEVTKVIGFSKKGDKVYFESTKESPLERHIYSVSINSRKLNKLSDHPGTHSAILSSDSRYLFDTYSSKTTPRAYSIIDTQSKKRQSLFKSDNPLEDYRLGEVEIGTIKAADNKTDLYYRMILPPDFDANKEYPCVVYVYGGPHVQLIQNRWGAGARGWDYYMAQEGYVVFTVDSRGSAGRGQLFEEVIHRNLGVNEMKDQMKGIDFLKQKNFIDKERIGVFGWSFGGFMTTSLMVNYPDVFKVGVAGGPVIDWQKYEVMYGERYMDSPAENPEGYAKTNLLKRAGDLQGKLLMIHGGEDPVVVLQHSLAFIRACVAEGKPIDYFIYPTAEHNVRGKDRVHLMEKVSSYFFDYL